jgi:hypothetical protein
MEKKAKKREKGFSISAVDKKKKKRLNIDLFNLGGSRGSVWSRLRFGLPHSQRIRRKNCKKTFDGVNTVKDSFVLYYISDILLLLYLPIRIVEKGSCDA